MKKAVNHIFVWGDEFFSSALIYKMRKNHTLCFSIWTLGVGEKVYSFSNNMIGVNSAHISEKNALPMGPEKYDKESGKFIILPEHLAVDEKYRPFHDKALEDDKAECEAAWNLIFKAWKAYTPVITVLKSEISKY